MKTQKPRRSRLFPAMLVIAATPAIAPAIHAGDVTVSTVDLNAGTSKPYVTGGAQHKPVYLLETKDNDVRLIDACGHVHMPKKSPFGERELVDMNFPDKSLRDIRMFVTPGRGSTFGIGQDGKPWMLMTQYFDYEKPDPRELTRSIDSPFDFGKMRHFIPGMGEVPDLAFFEDGGMLSTRDTLGEDGAQARFVTPRNGWGKIQHGTPIYVGSGRERRVILLTIDADGQLASHTPVVETDNDFNKHVTSMESAPIGNAKFTGTSRLFAGRYDEVAYRWTESGDLFAVDPVKGTETQLGNAGAFKGDLMIKPDKQAYLLATSGSFTACPAKAAPVVEAPKDTTIIAATDEIKALKAAHYFPIDGVIREPLPNMSGEFKTIEPAIQALFDKVSKMETTVVTPIREKTAAFVAKYGEQSVAESKLREVTGETWYMDGDLSSLQDVVERWDEYKLGIADNLAHQAGTGFLLGEHASDASLRGEHYRSAKPWAEWALRFSPSHEKATEYLAKADEFAGSAEAAFNQAIQERQWPEDITDVPDAVALKKRLLAFFQRRHNGGPHDQGARYFAIRLDSRWYVQEENIHGEPIEWRISAWVAETVPGDPKHARMHWLEAGTHSADKSKFSYTAGSSDSFLIPIERVPADDPAALKESRKLLGH